MKNTLHFLCATALALSPVQAASPIVPSDARLVEIWNKGEFTEGVAVHPNTGHIYFSDIPRGDKPGRVYRHHPESGRTEVFLEDSGKSNGLMFDRRGRLVMCCGANGGRMALCAASPQGKISVLVDRFEGKRLLSPNDLVIDRKGRVYFSDPRYIGPEPIELDHMSVYRFDPDGSLHRMTRDIQKPNGVMLSPDGKWFYVAETNNGSTGQDPDAEPKPGRMTLNRFPIGPDGSLGEKKVLVDFGKETGVDGMTVDTEGNLYAAVRSDSRFGIVVYDSGGRELAYIKTPALPTNCTFGTGKHARTLFVTAGGGLYRIKLNREGFHPAMEP